MNQMRYKKININKVLYKTWTSTNLNFKRTRFFFLNVKNKK